MDFLIVLGIAFGLAAFSLLPELTLEKVSTRQALRLGSSLGLFQFGMPIIGWFLGSLVAEQVHSVGTWIAFALLAGMSTKMIWEALRGMRRQCEAIPPAALR